MAQLGRPHLLNWWVEAASNLQNQPRSVNDLQTRTPTAEKDEPSDESFSEHFRECQVTKHTNKGGVSMIL